MNSHIVVYKFNAIFHFHVSGYYLGIICHNGAVIVVVSKVLVKIKAHARIEYMLQAFQFHKICHMAMKEFCRKTYGIAWYCGLPFKEYAPVGKRRNYNLKAELCEKAVPKNGHFIHVKAKRYAYFAASSLNRIE